MGTMDVMSEAFVRVEEVHKTYRLGEAEVRALRGVSLTLNKGEFTALVGASGSGKSTLLNLVGCLDEPDRGRILIEGRDVAHLSDEERSHTRNRSIGFIFQSFNLVPVLSVFQNVEFPLLLQRQLTTAERRLRVNELLAKVGLDQQSKHRPSELSGGQRQRVAIARALVTRPKIVLADEPTANLDSVTGATILDLMKEMNRIDKTTFIFSTHDANVMAHANLIVRLADGKIVGQDAAGGAGNKLESHP